MHNVRVSKMKAVVDTSEPEFLHHLERNVKKTEAEAEKQYELEAVSMEGLLNTENGGRLDKHSRWREVMQQQRQSDLKPSCMKIIRGSLGPPKVSRECHEIILKLMYTVRV